MKSIRSGAFLRLGILLLSAFIAAVAPAARAQDSTATVIKSPYTDFNEKTGLALLLGYFGGNRGQVGVGPQPSPMIGLSYLYHLGGPAGLVGRVAYAPSQRTVLNPVLGVAQRDLGTTSAPLILFDVGLSFNITGEKTWHRLVPTAGFKLGLGFGSNTPDIGGYSFGRKFYLGFGAGVTYALRDAWVLKADVYDFLWQFKYPTSYFTASPPILSPTAPDKEWRNSSVFALGVSYTLKR